jgi:hypothetical protein
MRGLVLAAAMGISMTGYSVSAQSGIRNEPVLDNGLFTVGLAHEIRSNCPQISARLLRGFSALRNLERTARDLGYSEDEMRRHLKSDAEKQRLRARAAEYMDARGFGQDQEGYCALGRSEIAQDSDIGALLRLEK